MLWFDLGACRDHDPAVFHPDPDVPEALARARVICARCQVRAECLEFALSSDDLDGMWGGLTATERARAVAADFGSMMRRR